MRARGTERIDGLGTAEEARKEYRNVVNERVEDPELSLRVASHDRIEKQASADFEAKQGAPWLIIRGSKKLKERFAKKLQRQKTRAARKAKR